MKAVVYIVNASNSMVNAKRYRNLSNFLSKENLEVESTYCDMLNKDGEIDRTYFYQLLNDLKSGKIEAEIFVAISFKDLGEGMDFKDNMVDLSNLIKEIYFVDLENA